jgi:hypothetical protein
LLVHGWWFSLGTPASSTTKTGRHDIAEILLKVALKHQKSNRSALNVTWLFNRRSTILNKMMTQMHKLIQYINIHKYTFSTIKHIKVNHCLNQLSGLVLYHKGRYVAHCSEVWMVLASYYSQSVDSLPCDVL